MTTYHEDMTLDQWAEAIHKCMKRKGFWVVERPDDLRGKHKAGNDLAVLMLIVTELGEAAECYRRGDTMKFVEELGDTLVRLLDFMAYKDIPIGHLLKGIMEANEEREHLHGKRC